MATPEKRVCVFCGSSTGVQPAFRMAAVAVGDELVRRRLGLVFGGGRVGLMGALADAVVTRGGHAIGVIPSFLSTREIAHEGLPDLRVVGSMHERKALMANLSDAFLVLPGGMGTLDETCEILTWGQLGLHHKPVGLLNVAGYFDAFVAFLGRARAEGFVREEHMSLLAVASDPEVLVTQLVSRMPGAESELDQRQV